MLGRFGEGQPISKDPQNESNLSDLLHPPIQECFGEAIVEGLLGRGFVAKPLLGRCSNASSEVDMDLDVCRLTIALTKELSGPLHQKAKFQGRRQRLLSLKAVEKTNTPQPDGQRPENFHSDTHHHCHHLLFTLSSEKVFC